MKDGEILNGMLVCHPSRNNDLLPTHAERIVSSGFLYRCWCNDTLVEDVDGLVWGIIHWEVSSPLVVGSTFFYEKFNDVRNMWGFLSEDRRVIEGCYANLVSPEGKAKASCKLNMKSRRTLLGLSKVALIMGVMT